MSTHECIHNYDSSCSDCVQHDEACGTRCTDCQERMCSQFGPEPRACSTVCVECRCDCQKCTEAREDMRADLLHQLEREARR